jgi:tetratricopeptide (TPR) repeat protein
MAPRPPAPGAAALLDRAEHHANHGDAADAARLCRDAIALDDTLERGHYLLGLLLLDTPAAAREHFRRAVNLDPGHLPARLHLAECAERTGNMIEALHEYRNLERLAGTKPPETILDPDEGITYGMLALIGARARRRLE